mgnify:CR=1 FL=1
MTNSRQKGAAFERTCANMLFDITGLEAKRDLEQYRASDHGDLIGVPGWTVECKRYANGVTWKPSWWEQCLSAANAAGNQPVPFLRITTTRKTRLRLILKRGVCW